MRSIEKSLLAFTLVFITSALWPKLPEVSLIIISCVLFSFITHLSASAYLTGAFLGFVWASIMGHWYTSWQLDDKMFNQNVIIEGSISSLHSLPMEGAVKEGKGSIPSIRINLSLDKVGKRSLVHSPLVRLTWYRPEHLPKQGQHFRLLVNLRKPTGLANPHTFHYQTWLASKNIVATGYVLQSTSNELLSDNVSLRQRSVDYLLKMRLEHGDWLSALSFGYRGELSDRDWQLLQQSGTAHLFAISGLHVGIVLGYCMLLFSKPFALCAGYLRSSQYQINKLGAAVAAFACMLYAYLAGFEVPVLRAVLAILLWVVLLIAGSHWRLPAVLLYLLSAFFILFPFSILSISFWFSFSAVLCIWLFLWRFMPKERLSLVEKLKYALYLQVWLSAVTFPITVYIFQQLPIFAVFANLVLVPWVSFVLVPLCLLGTLSIILMLPHALILFIYQLADDAMRFTLFIMNETVALAEHLKMHSLHLDHVSLGIAALIAMLILLPFWRFRKSLLALSLVAMFVRPQPTEKLLPTLTLFDVGQGSAAMFRFADDKGKMQTWLFDTGASFPSGFSMAASVLLPTFEHYKIKQLNALFLSHFDNDHAGGLNTLQTRVHIEKIFTPQHKCTAVSNEFASLAQANIQVKALWPLSAKSGDENNDSCVLKLQVGSVNILFAGDIEYQAEQAMLDFYHQSNELAADILIVPHHGSKTSSTVDFVKSVSPNYAVIQAAHPNRWGFPHAQVRDRYLEQGSKLLQTGKAGAIEFTFTSSGAKVSTYRGDIYRRWYFQPPS